MKMILLYGPGEAQKRSEALKIRRQFDLGCISILDFKQAGLKDLEISLSSSTLFDTGPRLVVAENMTDSFDLTRVKSVQDPVTLLILGINLKVNGVLLQSAKKMGATVYLFEGDRELSAFPFLDSLIEQKPQAFLELDKLLIEYGPMYTLTMIYYLLRRNILPLPPSAFIRQKIERQKRPFKDDDWERFYYLTLKTEFDIKSGKVPENLGLVRLSQAIIRG